MCNTELFFSASSGSVRPRALLSIVSLSVLLSVSVLPTRTTFASGSATLLWDASATPNLSGYKVRYTTTSGAYTASTNVGLTTSAAIGGLQDGATYYFAVAAVSDSGTESKLSNEAAYTVPGPAGSSTRWITNESSITIPDAGAGAPFPSPIEVSGLAGTITRVTLTLNGLSHGYPDDIDVLLVGPSGQKLMVLSDAGGSTPVSNLRLTFSDSAAFGVADDGPLASGEYQPTDPTPGEARDLFPAPAPAGPYSSSFACFNGQTPNGTWSLFVNDDGAGDQGVISGGWTLAITTAVPTNQPPTITDLPDQSTPANTPTPAWGFTVQDAETPAESLLLAARSANPALVPDANILVGGSGGNRTISVTPAPGASGTAVITVTVTDSSGSTGQDSFTLTVSPSPPPNPPPVITLTSPVADASYAAPATAGLAAAVTANGHTLTKVQFYSGSVLLGECGAAPWAVAWTNLPAGNYTVSARLLYDAESSVESPAVAFVVTALPPPWRTLDVGSVTTAGSASASAGTFTIEGAGNISGTADNFRFLHQPLSGDGRITARLGSIANTGTNGRVGVMIRETLTSGSRYAFMGVSPDGRSRWQRRSATSGSTSVSSSTGSVLPNVWLRLVRTGNSIYAYRSSNGTSWTKIGSQRITMAANIWIGLAVASGDPAALNTSSFSNTTVVP